MGSIRLIKNIILTTEFYGSTQDVLFKFGSIYPAIKIEQGPNGYANIHLKNGALIRGVSNSVFHNYHTPVVQVESVGEDAATEIESNVSPEASVPFEGTVIRE